MRAVVRWLHRQSCLGRELSRRPLWEGPMPAIDPLAADEAANLLRISRRTFDGHVARGDIAYIAVGLAQPARCEEG